MKKAFEKRNSLLAIRQAKNLQNVHVRARFYVVSKQIAPPKNIRIYNCQDKR